MPATPTAVALQDQRFSGKIRRVSTRMALSPGLRLGPYAIVSRLGAGGMGEVYKATDTRLQRAVAIKVLPPLVADEPGWRQRFDREAKTISSLNHPHICTLHDVGTQDGLDFLVMEYLDGETLAERLTKGPVPVEQALRYAIEIAGALDAAHRTGIVHRDLKPGNIMITAGGAKLLDFGLAKLRAQQAGPDAVSGAATMSGPLTTAGSVVGTVQYMAPEQLEGRDVDARTDIFAFGAVLHEMLTGRKAFEGATQVSVMGAILERPPAAVSALQAGIPSALDPIITTCLAKHPDSRWQSLADVRTQLGWILEAPGDAGAAPTARSRAVSRGAPVLALATTAVVALVVGFAGGWFATRPIARPSAAVSRLVLTPGDTTALVNVTGFDVVISPDGTQIVYLGERQQGGRALYLRGIAGLNPQMIPGTELPSDFTNANPFFSSDGEWVAYRSPTLGLVKIPINGGTPERIADLPPSVTFLGGAWAADGRVVVGLLRGGTENGLYGVDDQGQFTLLTPAAKEGLLYLAPAFLRDGTAVLFQVIDVETGAERVHVLDLKSGVERMVVDGGANPMYLATGHLVFARGTTLMAMVFDQDRLEARGTPVSVVEGVRHPGLVTAADYSLSRGGDLIYVPDMVYVSGAVTPVWVDRTGRTMGPAVAATLTNPRDLALSPDGTRMAVITGPANDGDLWVYDLTGRPAVPLVDRGDVRSPLWSPDGSRIYFTSNRGGGAYEVYSLPADGGTLDPTVVPTGAQSLTGDLTWRAPRSPLTWLPDGRLAFTNVRSTGGGADVVAVPREGGMPASLVATEFDEDSAETSPDGRFLAYRSTRTGRSEIWVRGLSDDAAPVRVSQDGGQEPLWSRDGRELYFLENNRLMRVAVSSNARFTFEPARPLFDAPYFRVPAALTVSGWSSGHSYDQAADGRFLMIPFVGQSDPFSAHTNIVVVQNWSQELSRMVPVR